MKINLPLTFVSVLLLSACASSPQSNDEAKAHKSTSATLYNYQCKSGALISATYPSTNSAKVKYKSKYYNLQIAVSGSGSRYVGDKLEWWTKSSGSGSEATLFQNMSNDKTGKSLELCKEVHRILNVAKSSGS